MKLNGKDNIINSNDIDILTNKHIGQNLTSVISTYDKKLDTLERNIKWIYKYGGVGGNRGGGNGSNNQGFSLFATLDGTQINNNNISLSGGIGSYEFVARIVKPSAEKYSITVTYTTKDGVKQTITRILSIESLYNGSTYAMGFYINLDINSAITVTVTDGIDYIQKTATYIVAPYNFSTCMLNYNEVIYSAADNDIYIDNAKKNGLYAALKYEIAIVAEINYKITGIIQEHILEATGQIKNKSGYIKLQLPDEILNDDYAGFYNIQFTLDIIPESGKPITELYNIGFSMIPNNLYLKVTPVVGIIYNKPQDFVYNEDNEDISTWYRYNPGFITFKLKVYNGTNTGDTWHIERTESFLPEGETEIIKQTWVQNVKERVEVLDSTIFAQGTGWHTLSYNINNGQKIITYYFYIYDLSSNLVWYDLNPNTEIYAQNYYRISNYTDAFKPFVKGNKTPYIAMRNNSATTIICTSEIKNRTLVIPNEAAAMDVMISIGIQYNIINEDTDIITFKQGNNTINISQSHVKYNDIEIPIYLNKIDGNAYGPTIQSSYHLLTILFRALTDVSKNLSEPYYELVVYIDGVLEGFTQAYLSTILQPSDIILSKGNYYINMMEVSYFAIDKLKDIDIVQYWYKYNQALLSNVMDDKIMSLTYFKQITYTQDNHIIINTEDAVKNMCLYQDIPTLIISCNDNAQSIQDKSSIEYIDERYDQDSEDAKTKLYVTLKWAHAKTAPQDINVPSSAQFYIKLQGSSSFGYRGKNFTLGIEGTSEAVNDDDEIPLYTPNYASSTSGDLPIFLPEEEFTLKADIVDSSHSNNTAIGAFINAATTPFNTGETSQYKKHIKNCLEGFPVFVIFAHIEKGYEKPTYYIFGIYNFNLGRGSYYNLGYKDTAALQLGEVKTPSFIISSVKKGNNNFKKEFIVAEISGGSPYFDFSQYDDSILFSLDAQNNTDKNFMWDDAFYGDSGTWQSRVKAFTKKIARGGGYIFERIGKKFGSYSDKYHAVLLDEEGNEILDSKGNVISANQVPDYKYQYIRKMGNNTTYTPTENSPYDAATVAEFNWVIYDNPEESDPDNRVAALDLQSAVEYYVICMAFGLVDSVQKNLNIKTWNGKKFYIAFYDMDTCLGIDNAGYDVAYFAFSDYWTTMQNGQTVVYRDFYPDRTNNDQIPLGYDIPSSYLFAIAKYASIQDKDLTIFPAQLWANYRRGKNKGGLLPDADTFIDNYYKKHLSNVSEMAFNINYRFKYFVKGSTSFASTEYQKFHGRRIEKVRDWLKGRFHLLDAYFNLTKAVINIQHLNNNKQWEDFIYMGNNVLESIPTNIDMQNKDIYILQDIFMGDTIGESGLQYTERAFNPIIQTQQLSPLSVKVTNTITQYLYEKANTDYNFYLKSDGNQFIKFGGSKMWTKLDSINPFILDSFSLHNDYIDTLIGTNGTVKTWSLNMPSLKVLTLTSPYYSGILAFNKNNPNLTSVNIDNTQINLSIDDTNVLNVSAKYIKANTLTIKNCNYINSILIGGSTFNTLTITPMGVTNFEYNSTAAPKVKKDDIEQELTTVKYAPGLSTITLEISGPIIEEGQENNNTIVISNDNRLQDITISNYANVTIQNCANLRKIRIADTNILKNITVIRCGNNISEHENFKLYDLNEVSDKSYVDLHNQKKLQNFAIKYQERIEKVILKENTVLSDEAFIGCINIQYVDVLNSTTGEYITNNNNGIILNGKSIFNGLYKYGIKMSNDAYTPLQITEECTTLEGLFAQIEERPNILITFKEVQHIIALIPPINNINNIAGMFKFCVNIKYDSAIGFDEYKSKRFGYGKKNEDKNTQNTTIFKYLYYVNNCSEMFMGCNISFCNKFMFQHEGSTETNDIWKTSASYSDSFEWNEKGQYIGNDGNYGLGARVNYINTANMITGAEILNATGVPYYCVVSTEDCLYPIITKTERYHPSLFGGDNGYYIYSSGTQKVQRNDNIRNAIIDNNNTNTIKVIGKTEVQPINLIKLFRYNSDGRDNLTLISNINFLEFYSADCYINFGANNKTGITETSITPDTTPVFSAIWSRLTSFDNVLTLGYTHFMNAEYLLYHMSQLTHIKKSFIQQTTNIGLNIYNFINWDTYLASNTSLSNINETTTFLNDAGHNVGRDTRYTGLFTGNRYITYNDYKRLISKILNSKTLTNINCLFENTIIFVPFDGDIHAANNIYFNGENKLYIDEHLGDIYDYIESPLFWKNSDKFKTYESLNDVLNEHDIYGRPYVNNEGYLYQTSVLGTIHATINEGGNIKYAYLIKQDNDLYILDYLENNNLESTQPEIYKRIETDLINVDIVNTDGNGYPVIKQVLQKTSIEKLTYPINTNIIQASQAFSQLHLYYTENGEADESLSNNIPVILGEHFLNTLPALTNVSYMFAYNEFAQCIPYNMFEKRYLSINGMHVYVRPKDEQGNYIDNVYYDGELYLYEYQHTIQDMCSTFAYVTYKNQTDKYFTPNYEDLNYGYMPSAEKGCLYYNEYGILTSIRNIPNYELYQKYNESQLNADKYAINNIHLYKQHTLNPDAITVSESDITEVDVNNIVFCDFYIVKEKTNTPKDYAPGIINGTIATSPVYNWDNHVCISMKDYGYEIQDVEEANNLYNITIPDNIYNYLSTSEDAEYRNILNYINNQTAGTYSVNPNYNKSIWSDELGYAVRINQYNNLGLEDDNVSPNIANNIYTNTNNDIEFIKKIKSSLAFTPDIFYGCTPNGYITNTLSQFTGKAITGLMPKYALKYFTEWSNDSILVQTFYNINIVPRYINSEFIYYWEILNIDNLTSDQKSMVNSNVLPNLLYINGIKYTFHGVDTTIKYRDKNYNFTDFATLTKIQIDKHYTFIPSKFINHNLKNIQLEYAFNFYVTLPSHYIKDIYDITEWFSIMEYDSIPKDTFTLYSSLPSQGSTIQFILNANVEDDVRPDTGLNTPTSYWYNAKRMPLTISYNKEDNTEYRYTLDLDYYNKIPNQISTYDSLGRLINNYLSMYLYGPIFNKSFIASSYTWNMPYLYTTYRFSHYILLPHITTIKSNMIYAENPGNNNAVIIKNTQYVDPDDNSKFYQPEYNNSTSNPYVFFTFE